MRFVAVYRPADPGRAGRGLRRFLYVESMTRDQVLEHARENTPEGYALSDVEPARRDTHYLAVPSTGGQPIGDAHGPA